MHPAKQGCWGRGGWGRWKVYVGKELGAAAKAAPDSREGTPGAFTKPRLLGFRFTTDTS